MPAIFIKKEKDSSRNRRRERRKTAREQSYDEGHLIRKAAIELHGGAAQLKAEKAISGMTEFEKCKQKKECGEDAMYHKVNHAHQRNANKKWS